VLSFYDDFIYLLRDVAHLWPWPSTPMVHPHARDNGVVHDPITAASAIVLQRAFDVESYRIRRLPAGSRPRQRGSHRRGFRPGRSTTPTCARILSRRSISRNAGRRRTWNDTAFHQRPAAQLGQPIRHGGGSAGIATSAWSKGRWKCILLLEEASPSLPIVRIVRPAAALSITSVFWRGSSGGPRLVSAWAPASLDT